MSYELPPEIVVICNSKMTKATNGGLKKETEKIYKTFDGKSFDRLWEAQEHDKDLLWKTLLESIENVKSSYQDVMIPPDGEYHNTDSSFIWFNPKTKDDIALLNRMFHSYWGAKEKLVNDNDVGEWICFETMCDSGDDYTYYLKHAILYCEKFFSRFGYKVKIEKED